ncbi:SUR7 [Candida theae]|uniref:SUR7 n=1 Tax=Candida theae TaxID=1198502 RepID=A0AAD5G036_9ASCO|nr:SUR7 [Candida theae]KAI5964492.1 SUR7 [Candida theae]
MKLIGTFFNLFFLAGACLLLIFIVLSGSSRHFPLNKFYWLEADTTNISNSPANTSAWTFWGVCDKNDYSKCLTGPAYPLSPEDNFDTTTNIPQDFLDNQSTYYYLSRFAFAFCLIALGFSGLAFIIDILGFCFTIIDKVVMFLVTAALFFAAAFASFQTAVTVLAKNAFSDAGRHATVGAKSMGIMWAAFVCLLICWGLTFAAIISNSYRKHMERVNQNKQEKEQGYGYNDDAAGAHGQQGYPKGVAASRDDSSFTRAHVRDEDEEANNGGIRFFKIKRNQKVVEDESA